MEAHILTNLKETRKKIICSLLGHVLTGGLIDSYYRRCKRCGHIIQCLPEPIKTPLPPRNRNKNQLIK